MISLKELRKLPFRQWNTITEYRSVIVIPSGKKHSSGWHLMYVIGLDSERKPIEIAAVCDDISWKIPKETEYDFRNDMFYPNGAIHFWSNKYNFMVMESLSSTDIKLIERCQK